MACRAPLHLAGFCKATQFFGQETCSIFMGQLQPPDLSARGNQF